jgi:colanic acid biosynthesis protein WcaH
MLERDFYRVIMKHCPICTVDVLLFDKSKDHILLCQRRNEPLKGVFFTPGGRLLKNEYFEDAALRQVKKELGVTIQKKDLIFGGVLNEVHENSIFRGINYHSVNVYFAVVLPRMRRVRLDEQHERCQWFSVYTRTLNPLVRQKIRSVLHRL